MSALTKALDPFNQFEGSAAHSVAIMAFDLVILASPWAGNTSLHGDDDVAK